VRGVDSAVFFTTPDLGFRVQGLGVDSAVFFTTPDLGFRV
jgi:hypothetical protein